MEFTPDLQRSNASIVETVKGRLNELRSKWEIKYRNFGISFFFFIPGFFFKNLTTGEIWWWFRGTLDKSFSFSSSFFVFAVLFYFPFLVFKDETRVYLQV